MILKQIEQFIKNTTFYKLMGFYWIVFCVLVAITVIAAPQLTWFVLLLMFLASLSFVMFAISKRKNIYTLRRVFDIGFDFIFDDLASSLKKDFSSRRKRKIALKLLDTSKIISIGIMIISSALAVLIFHSSRQQNSQSRSAVTQPIPSITVLPTATVLPTPTFTPIRQIITIVVTATPQPAAFRYPSSISPNISWSITSTLPITLAVSPHLRILQEYNDLVSVLIPRIAIVEVDYLEQNSNFNTEYVLLVNYGDPVDISNWYLTDDENHQYLFKNFSLGSGDAVYLHTGQGTDSEFHLYWGNDDYIWLDEPHLILYNQFGAVVDEWRRTAR